jgi:hypothetical protein
LDKTVRVWSAGNRTELLCLRGHEKEVERVAFSTDGQYIVSGGQSGDIRIWNAKTGVCLEQIDGLGDVAAIAAGLPLRAVARGAETAIVDAASRQAIGWLPIAFDRIATHPDGRRWAGSVGKRLHLFQLEDTA